MFVCFFNIPESGNSRFIRIFVKISVNEAIPGFNNNLAFCSHTVSSGTAGNTHIP
jgi:hypothetical protein